MVKIEGVQVEVKRTGEGGAYGEPLTEISAALREEIADAIIIKMVMGAVEVSGQKYVWRIVD